MNASTGLHSDGLPPYLSAWSDTRPVCYLVEPVQGQQDTHSNSQPSCVENRIDHSNRPNQIHQFMLDKQTVYNDKHLKNVTVLKSMTRHWLLCNYRFWCGNDVCPISIERVSILLSVERTSINKTLIVYTNCCPRNFCKNRINLRKTTFHR